MKKKIFASILCFCMILPLNACQKNDSEITGYSSVAGVSNPDTNFNPEETIDAIFRHLTEGDSYGFNQYICYPSGKNGILYSGYNILFGAKLDEEEETGLKLIMSGLECVLKFIPAICTPHFAWDLSQIQST